jgi:ParB-like chromosome segregation protein Spo0J
MAAWSEGEVRPLAIEALGERYRRYRLADAPAEEAMARSLRQYGQASPVVVCMRDGQAELLDGFKRRAAASLVPLRTLSVRVIEADEAMAKAAIYGLNRVAGPPTVLEEAWIVHALVREDGLTQVQAAELLDHHKSWVNRRLALLERLCVEARDDLRLGLLAPSLARQLARLPVGNQSAVLTAARREALTAAEARGVIDLLRGASVEQEAFILDKPREALLQAEGVQGPIRDVRLSPAGNRVAKQLRYLLDALGHMENWLRYPGLAELRRDDCVLLTPRFEGLARDARTVAALVEDLLLQQTLASRPTAKHQRMGASDGREFTQRDCAALAGADAGTPDCAGAGRIAEHGASRDRALAAGAFGSDAGNVSAAAGATTEPPR